MKILIGADIVPTVASEKYFIDGVADYLFTDIIDVVKRADRFILNLECALTLSDNGIKKIGPCLKADPKCINAIKKLGVTDLALSNNHIFDFGVKGLNDTIETLKKNNIGFFGVGANSIDANKIYYMQKDGHKIAIVNVCEHEYSYATENRMGANSFDVFDTMFDIRQAKENADYVIVLYHGGKELCRYPSPRLRSLCRAMVKSGASVVITQHSHCIGSYENYNSAHILYGQGNFHFVFGNNDEIWNTCLLTEFDFSNGVNVVFYPVVVEGVQASLAKGALKEKILKEFEIRNEQMKNGTWKNGWKEFCLSVKESYTDVLKNIGDSTCNEKVENKWEMFAHYLDCEAHTDVWKELFTTWNHVNEL